jgi:hypothetical protein
MDDDSDYRYSSYNNGNDVAVLGGGRNTDQLATIGRMADDSTIVDRDYYKNSSMKASPTKTARASKPSSNIEKLSSTISNKPSTKSTTTISMSKTSSSVHYAPPKQQRPMVRSMTTQQYHHLAEDRTTVIVNSKPTPKPKTSVITVKKEISDYYDDDPLGSDFAEMCADIQNSPLNLRFFTCIIALFMVIASVIDYSDESYYGDVSMLYTFVSLYVWIFAIFLITLEISPFKQTPTEIHRELLKLLRVLRFSWGRGFLYIFSGVMQVLLLTSWNIVAGVAMMVAGMITICIGKKAQEKLKVFVRKMGSTDNIDNKFNKYDIDRDGFLNPEEFGSMISDMKINMSFDEFVSAFQAIDRNCDRLITREDLGIWWTKYKSNEKRKQPAALALV